MFRISIRGLNKDSNQLTSDSTTKAGMKTSSIGSLQRPEHDNSSRGLGISVG
jgi:hypothetical protein